MEQIWGVGGSGGGSRGGGGWRRRGRVMLIFSILEGIIQQRGLRTERRIEAYALWNKLELYLQRRESVEHGVLCASVRVNQNAGSLFSKR